MSSPLRQRLGWGHREDLAPVFIADRSVEARALMYLLAGIATAIVASMAIPDGPLAHQKAVPILAAVTYAAAVAVLVGFDKLPRWGFHALLFAVTALICWTIYKTHEPGSPYKVFFFWVAIYAAFFMTARMTAVHIGAMIAAYGGVLLAIHHRAQFSSLHWALTASALILVGIAIQALNASVHRLIDRLTEIGRTDSLTGLWNAQAFSALLENEIERARRSGNRMGVVIAEIDGFAPFGKEALAPADQRRLAAVGEVFLSRPRQIDLAARLGGGRFALLLPYTDEHGAYLLAERLRSALAEVAAEAAVKVSFGVAGFPRHGASGQAVFQAAEAALSDAQAAGGARVMLFQRHTSAAHVEVELPAPEELIG